MNICTNHVMFYLIKVQHMYKMTRSSVHIILVSGLDRK